MTGKYENWNPAKENKDSRWTVRISLNDLVNERDCLWQKVRILHFFKYT